MSKESEMGTRQRNDCQSCRDGLLLSTQIRYFTPSFFAAAVEARSKHQPRRHPVSQFSPLSFFAAKKQSCKTSQGQECNFRHPLGHGDDRADRRLDHGRTGGTQRGQISLLQQERQAETLSSLASVFRAPLPITFQTRQSARHMGVIVTRVTYTGIAFRTTPVRRTALISLLSPHILRQQKWLRCRHCRRIGNVLVSPVTSDADTYSPNARR